LSINYEAVFIISCHLQERAKRACSEASKATGYAVPYLILIPDNEERCALPLIKSLNSVLNDLFFVLV
jgi:hypothetical protein